MAVFETTRSRMPIPVIIYVAKGHSPTPRPWSNRISESETFSFGEDLAIAIPQPNASKSKHEMNPCLRTSGRKYFLTTFGIFKSKEMQNFALKTKELGDIPRFLVDNSCGWVPGGRIPRANPMRLFRYLVVAGSSTIAPGKVGSLTSRVTGL